MRVHIHICTYTYSYFYIYILGYSIAHIFTHIYILVSYATMNLKIRKYYTIFNLKYYESRLLAVTLAFRTKSLSGIFTRLYFLLSNGLLVLGSIKCILAGHWVRCSPLFPFSEILGFERKFETDIKYHAIGKGKLNVMYSI